MEQRHTPRGINMGSENKHGEQKHTQEIGTYTESRNI